MDIKYVHFTDGSKKRLTKRLADELCFELWGWLYHHPRKENMIGLNGVEIMELLLM